MTPVQGLWKSTIKCKDGPYRANWEISGLFQFYLRINVTHLIQNQRHRFDKRLETCKNCARWADFSHLQACVVGNHFVSVQKTRCHCETHIHADLPSAVQESMAAWWQMWSALQRARENMRRWSFKACTCCTYKPYSIKSSSWDLFSFSVSVQS